VSAQPVPHRIVFANEKGGTGKSTTAVHVAIALAYQGARVAAIDLDPRQRTLHRYFENRAETMRRRGIVLPGARFAVFEGPKQRRISTVDEELGRAGRFPGVRHAGPRRSLSRATLQPRPIRWSPR
jgi:chromosome partitioning protein